MRPKDYLEFHYEAVTICMNETKQVLITREEVEDKYYYIVNVSSRGEAGSLEEDSMTRSWAVPPSRLESTLSTRFYGESLRLARGICGWVKESDET